MPTRANSLHSPGFFLSFPVRAGFTLLELMIVLTITAILTALAIPGFNAAVKRSSIDGMRDALGNALQMARSEAVSRHQQTVICASSSGASCAGNWQDGWLIFVDIDASASFNAASDQLIDRRYANNRVIISTSQKQFVFAANGSQSAGLQTIDFCDASSPAAVSGKALQLSRVGAVRRLTSTSC